MTQAACASASVDFSGSIFFQVAQEAVCVFG